MKIIVFHLISTLIAIILLSACTQTEDLQDPCPQPVNTTRAEDSQSDDDFFSSSLATRIQIATWLAENYSLKDAKRIHNSVIEARKMGLDEIYYLKEYASTNTSTNKISIEEPTQTSLKFSAELCNAIVATETSVSTQALNPSHLFNHERLEIYWPYSDNWDGITTPVVAFAPNDMSALKTEGFILKKGYLQSVIIDEEYCENHPVWLITENETPYSILPNFSSGDIISPDGVLYSPNSTPTIGSGKYPFPLDSIKVSPVDPFITTLHLGYVRAEKNHDSFFAGGSEYMFRFASLTNTNLTCEADTSKCIPDLAKTRICFTRKEIKKKTQKELNAIAVSSWPKSLDNIVMTLVEEDSGNSECNYDATITVTWADKKYGFDISIPYRNLDDRIAERTYSRDFILSTNNYKGVDDDGNDKWYEDTSDGVYWTLPYEIGWQLKYEHP